MGVKAWFGLPEARSAGRGQVETAAGDAMDLPVGVALQGQPGPDRSQLGTVRATAAWSGFRRLFGGLMATAVVDAPDEVAAAVTPAFLEMVAADLIIDGESTWAIDGDTLPIVLHKMVAVTIYGKKKDRSDWYLHGTIPKPSEASTERWEWDQVVHIVHHPDPYHPWRGQGLLAASEGRVLWTGNLAAGDRMQAPFGTLLNFAPDSGSGALGMDKRQEMRQAIARSVPTLRGNIPVQIMADKEQMTVTPINDNLQPLQQIVIATDAAFAALRDAAGVPAALMPGRELPQPDSVREAASSFLELSLMPMARIIAAELASKFGREVKLDLSHLRANEIAGASRAAMQLVKAEYDPAKVAETVGLPTLI